MTVLNLPFSLQPNSFSCGPAALHNALLVLGINRPIHTLARLAGTTKRHGTPEAGLSRAANVRRVACDTPAFAIANIRAYTPVLLCVDSDAEGAYAHWIAVVRTTQKYVWVADSSRPGPILRRYTWRQLMQRFHFYGERYYIYVVNK